MLDVLQKVVISPRVGGGGGGGEELHHRQVLQLLQLLRHVLIVGNPVYSQDDHMLRIRAKYWEMGS
jgi:hypothetical protein